MTSHTGKDFKKQSSQQQDSSGAKFYSFNRIAENKPIKQILGNTLISCKCNPFLSSQQLFFDFYGFGEAESSSV